ncbi:MAG TPA: flippase [Candidatus Gastranaerophilales bacterium]|nr:flippase [Candidatus Gastranaerophilales bacterium]
MFFIKNAFKKIFNTENKINIAKNSGWLILDHGIKIIFGILVGAWVARYLGPDDYGKFNYALALLALFSPFSDLGLLATVPKELINREAHQENIIGSAFFLKFFGGILILILSVLVCFWTYPNDIIYLFLTFFIGLSFLFKSFDVLSIWFLNKLQSKYTVIARTSGLMVSALFKIFFIISGFSLVYFSIALTIESFIISLILIFLFIKTEPFFNYKKIKLNFKESFNLIKISWVFILSAFLNMIMLNIDKIMIEKMLGSYELGLYSVIAFFSYYFIILANCIFQSTYPILIKLDKNNSFEHYTKDFQKLLNYLAISAYFIIIIIFFNYDFIVQFLWGSQYKNSGYLLSIQIFSILPFFIGLSTTGLIIVKNYIKLYVITIFTGTIINALLNYFLIKRFGAAGASYATIITFFWCNNIIYLFSDKTRHLFKMQLKALFLADYIKLIVLKILKLP